MDELKDLWSANDQMVKALIVKHDDVVAKEHCKGMDGLVKKAVKRTIDDAKKLEAAVKDMHTNDELMIELAESAVNAIDPAQ